MPEAPHTANAAERVDAQITDLFTLHLSDGLPVESAGKTLRYKLVRLRETGVVHERRAVQQAERVVMVGGAARLLVSDADFRFALTAQHIEGFECDGLRIPDALIDLATVGKLSAHDFGLIEGRVFLIQMAAQVRYGQVKPEDFEQFMRGDRTEAADAPQPVGQTAEPGANAAAPESGPALLADYVGSAAAGKPAGEGR